VLLSSFVLNLITTIHKRKRCCIHCVVIDKNKNISSSNHFFFILITIRTRRRTFFAFDSSVHVLHARVKFRYKVHRIILLALSANTRRNKITRIITRVACFVHRHDGNVTRSLFELLYKHVERRPETDSWLLHARQGKVRSGEQPKTIDVNRERNKTSGKKFGVQVIVEPVERNRRVPNENYYNNNPFLPFLFFVDRAREGPCRPLRSPAVVGRTERPSETVGRGVLRGRRRRTEWSQEVQFPVVIEILVRTPAFGSARARVL